MSNEQLTELEIKLAFQEDLLETLNKIVSEQQVQIELLQGQMRLLYQQLKSLQPTDVALPVDEVPPPHY